jgi:hypothetical protein
MIEKNAETDDELKNAKISTAKLHLKVQNIYCSTVQVSNCPTVYETGAVVLLPLAFSQHDTSPHCYIK